jgi:shikimate dehydrogenase
VLIKGKAAILGNPVDHSLSPTMHKAAYKELKISWDYEKFKIDPRDFADFVTSQRDYNGFSVTMPLKDTAFEFATSHDDYSLLTKACNTLIRESDGSWSGFNTDVAGFISILSPVIKDAGTACVIGSGATARSAIAALAHLGYKEIAISARRKESTEELSKFFPELNFVYQDISQPIADLVISTVPAGGSDLVKLDSRTSIFFDVIYAPWPTKLASSALNQNCRVFSGLHLLAAQAVEQVTLMTQCDRAKMPRLFEVMYAAGLVQQNKGSI